MINKKNMIRNRIRTAQRTFQKTHRGGAASVALIVTAVFAVIMTSVLVGMSSLSSYALSAPSKVPSPMKQIGYPIFYDPSKFSMSNADWTLNPSYGVKLSTIGNFGSSTADNDTVALPISKVREGVTFTNPFSVRFDNVGFAADGTALDVEVKCTKIYIGGLSYGTENSGISPSTADYVHFFGIRRDYSGSQQPLMMIGGNCTKAGSNEWVPGLSYKTEMTLQYTFWNGSSKYTKPISMYFEDLDMPGSGGLNVPGDTNHDGDLSDEEAAVSFTVDPEWREQVQLGNGFGRAYISNDSILEIKNSNTTFIATGNQPNTGNYEFANLASNITGGSGTFTFRGVSCFSAAGLPALDQLRYPDWNRPSKAVASGNKTYNLGDTVQYEMSVDIPYTNDALLPRSIKFYDDLNDVFDVSTVRLISVKCNGTNVTRNWKLSTSGRRITISTTDTDKGNAMGTVVATFEVRIKDDANLDAIHQNPDGTYTVNNTCIVDIDGDGQGSSNTEDSTIEINGAPNLILEKTADITHISGEDIEIGMPITFKIKVTNDSEAQSVTNLNIDDELQNCTVDYSTGKRELGPGESTTFTATYDGLTVDDVLAGKVTNWASATADWNDEQVESNRDDATTTIDNSPGLTLEKTPPTQTVKGTDAVIGHEISWVIKVTNTGNVPLTNVSIDDHLDGASVDTSGFDGNLAVGASHDFNVTYALTKEDIVRGTVDNTAIAHGDWVGGDVDSDEDTAHVDIENDPELTLTKDPESQTIDDEHAVPGTTVTWTIVVENTGQVEISNVTVDESALPGCTVSPSSPVTLAPGASQEYTATYKITQADIDKKTVHNVAIAHGEWVGGDIDSNEDTADVTINAVPHISIEKTTDNPVIPLEDAKPGTVITYHFLITNDGHQTLTDVNINDHLANIENVAIDWETSSDKSTDDGTLAPNETVKGSATYTITQADIDVRHVTNVANAESKDPSNQPVNSDDDDVTTEIETKDELTVDKTVDKDVIEGDEIAPGTLLTYTIVITNTGNRTVSDVSLEDQLEGIDGPVIDWSTSTDETTGEGVLLPGESVTATATYTLTQNDIDMAEVINVVIAHGTDPDGEPVDSDPDDAETVIDVHDELVLEKVVDKTELSDDEMFVGQTLNYSFTLVNNGDRTVHDVEFEDYLQGLSDITVDWEGSSDIETEAGVLSPDEVVTATATYNITQNDIDNCQVTNTAIVHSKLPNDDPFDSNESTVTTIINADAEFIIEKQVDKAELKGDEAVPGTTLNYTFHLTNNGDRTIRNVELDDYLDGVYDLAIDWSTSTDDSTGDGTLAPGEMVDASGKYDITQADIDAGKVVNTVIAHGTLGGEYDPNQKPVDEPDDNENGNTNENINGNVDGNENTNDNENDGGNSGDENMNENENIVAEPDDDGVADDEQIDDVERIDSNESTVQTAINQTPHLSLTKVADKEHVDPAYPDDVITYSFTITNDGNVTLNGINIVDDLHGISEIEYDWSGSSTGDNTLAPGDTVTATATYAITQQDLDAGEVVNTATAHGAAPDNSDVASDPAEAKTTLVDGNSDVASDLISTQDLIQTGAMVGGGIVAAAATAGIAAIVAKAVRKRH